MPFESYRIHEVPDDVLAALDYCYEQGWTDGLPVVPPVTDRVEATLAYEGRPPEAVIATHPATGLQLSVHVAAVNAVMAGCLPEYFPVLIAAFEAMDKPEFNFHGSTASTGGSAPLLIVSGPVADDIGMNADVNLFGPGNRANATIGRAGSETSTSCLGHLEDRDARPPQFFMPAAVGPLIGLQPSPERSRALQRGLRGASRKAASR
jgi:hypothetical protein